MEFTITPEKVTVIILPDHPSLQHAKILSFIHNNKTVSRTSLLRSCQRMKAERIQQIIADLKTDGLIVESVNIGKPGRNQHSYTITDKAITLFKSK